jgi:hypothetical protein
MVSKKIYILIFSIIAIFTGVVLYFAATYEEKKFSIIIDPSHKIVYKNNIWNIEVSNLAAAEEGYEIYDENGYLGNYIVSHLKSKNRWFIYNKDMSEVNKTGEVFGFKSNIDYEYLNLDVSSVTSIDEQYIKNALNKNNLNIDIDNAYSKKYIIDLNGDNKEDTLILSNLSYDDSYESSSYAVAVAIIKNKEYTLYLKGRKNDQGYEVPFVNLVATFDIGKDGYKELFLKETYFGESNSCVNVIEFTKEGFEKRAGC